MLWKCQLVTREKCFEIINLFIFGVNLQVQFYCLAMLLMAHEFPITVHVMIPLLLLIKAN